MITNGKSAFDRHDVARVLHRYTLVIFGAIGAIGQALCEWHLSRDCSVIGIARKIPVDSNSRVTWIEWDPCQSETAPAALVATSIDAVIWAQGMNMNDNARTFDAAAHRRIYDANVLYILISLKSLLDSGALAMAARLVVISSIWQNIARSNKLSYGITKSALMGLVQSISLDQGVEGKLVNAVLPGALDTPMTRANLSPEQIGKLSTTISSPSRTPLPGSWRHRLWLNCGRKDATGLGALSLPAIRRKRWSKSSAPWQQAHQGRGSLTAMALIDIMSIWPSAYRTRPCVQAWHPTHQQELSAVR